MKLRAILEGRWYTGRNAHQIWAEWAVWARWQILNGSQFFFHFNDKWLSVDNISWIYYQICLDKKFLLTHLRDCCELWIGPTLARPTLVRATLVRTTMGGTTLSWYPNYIVVVVQLYSTTTKQSFHLFTTEWPKFFLLFFPVRRSTTPMSWTHYIADMFQQRDNKFYKS